MDYQPGQQPNEETVRSRVEDCGWSEAEARRIPIGKREHLDGRLNVAKFARELEIEKPSLVQKLMRDGLELDQAVEEAWRREGKG